MPKREDTMTSMPDIVLLKDQHQELENSITTERTRPHPNETVISDLKKQKLRIRDQIERLSEA